MKTLFALLILASASVVFADTRICGTLITYLKQPGCTPEDLSCPHSGPGNPREQLAVQIDGSSGDPLDVSSASAEVTEDFARVLNHHVCLYGLYAQQNLFYVQRVDNK